MMENKTEVWTIGHSTRPFDEFAEMLRSFEIITLADVRSFPGSRRYPQFNQVELATSLAATGIEYQHFPELGGRRRAKSDSINIAWRNEGFRGYADYMETEDFRKGIDRLIEIATARRVTIMCAEALWWRCHRSLISDYLKVQNIQVMHIMSNGKAEPHSFTSAAQIVNGALSYRGILSTED